MLALSPTRSRPRGKFSSGGLLGSLNLGIRWPRQSPADFARGTGVCRCRHASSEPHRFLHVAPYRYPGAFANPDRSVANRPAITANRPAGIDPVLILVEPAMSEERRREFDQRHGKWNVRNVTDDCPALLKRTACSVQHRNATHVCNIGAPPQHTKAIEAILRCVCENRCGPFRCWRRGGGKRERGERRPGVHCQLNRTADLTRRSSGGRDTHVNRRAEERWTRCLPGLAALRRLTCEKARRSSGSRGSNLA